MRTLIKKQQKLLKQKAKARESAQCKMFLLLHLIFQAIFKIVTNQFSQILCSVVVVIISLPSTYFFSWCGLPITPLSRALSELWESSPVFPNRAVFLKR